MGAEPRVPLPSPQSSTPIPVTLSRARSRRALPHLARRRAGGQWRQLRSSAKGNASAWSANPARARSTIALALMRLIRPPGKIECGQMLLEGVDLLGLTEEEMRQVRLARIALVAQGAMNSLNPGDARAGSDPRRAQRPWRQAVGQGVRRAGGGVAATASGCAGTWPTCSRTS